MKSSTPTTSETDSCPNCGRPWRTTTYILCDSADCCACDISASLGAGRRHIDALNEDADAVAVWKCAHGTEWSLRCRDCRHEVSNWGMGTAGFRDLCGCENSIASG